MKAPLYTTEILRLAVDAARHGRIAEPHASAEGRTPVCGSRIILDLSLDDAGRVATVGFDLHACAMGQAAAGLLGAHAAGRDAAALAATADALAQWLAGERDDAPDWPGIAALAPARAYPARHAAMVLPFRIAAQAAAHATEEQDRT